MGMTMAEKILAHHSGLRKVEVGQSVTAKIDQVCFHDSFLNIDIDMKKAGIKDGLKKVWDRERVFVVTDHDSPAMDRNVPTATRHVQTRKLVKALDLPYYYDVKAGICHHLLEKAAPRRVG